MGFMQWMQVFGGLAIFIFGMKLMSDGLHHVAGEKMRSILRMFSANRVVGVISGTLVTCVIQSSSASTVMVIGFVNAGLLSLVQAMGLIFGANIGTTITAQLVAFDIAWIIMPSIILGLLMSFVPRQRIANWSETIIGFTVIALGTSLPELVTTLTAIRKKEASLSVGNIVGANIIDTTLILPLCAVINGTPLPVERVNLVFDFPVCIAACAVAVVPTIIQGKFKKWQGFALLTIYVAYMALLVLNETGVVALG